MSNNKKTFPFEKAICYSGYRKGQSPREEIYPSKEEISEDLHLLIDRGFTLIRMYDPNEHAKRVLEVITEEKLPLRCMIGIDPIAEVNNPGCPWDKRVRSEEELKANAERNDAELRKLVELANQYREEIIAVSIGNENQPDWGSDIVPQERLVQQAKYLQANVKQLVTYNEGTSEWLHLQDLVKELDIISIHSYPVWNHVGVDDAVAYNAKDYAMVKEAYPDKQIIFTECGWPTDCNDSMDKTQVDEEKQAKYIQEFLAWTEKEQIPAFLFEGFDEPWKGSEAQDEPEKHWGLFYEDRTPKKIYQ